MKASKFKRKPKEAERCDDLEHGPPTFPKKPHMKLKQYIGKRYKNPVKILIAFEYNDHVRALKLMNKTGQSFTAVVNDGLSQLLERSKIPQIPE